MDFSDSNAKAPEEWLSSAFRIIPDALVISRISDSMVLQVNKRWEEIFGFTHEETVGRSAIVMDLTDPKDRAEATELLGRHGRLKEHEIRIKTRSGQRKIVQISAEKIDFRGEACVLSILRDVTKKREAERSAREKERLYRTLAANIPNSIIVLYDRDFNILVAEGAGLSRFGITPGMVEGRNLRDVDPSGQFPRVEQYYKSALAGVPAYHESETHGRLWAVDNVPVPDESGEITAGLMVCRDLTDFKRTVLSLEDSEKNNQSLLDAIPDAIFHFDSAGTCVDFSPGHGSQAAFWTREGVIGRSMRDFFADETAYLLAESLFNARKTDTTQGCEFTMPWDKEMREMEARTVPFGRENVLVLIRDITGSRNLERLAANIASREQRRLGGELHDGICQELTGISLHCRSLEDKLVAQNPGLVKQMAEISGYVGDAIRHVRALIEGLYPPGLERGLAEALRELVTKLGRTYPAAFSFIGEGQAVDPDVAAHLYRIAQEAAGNAARHGKPSTVRIYLGHQEDNLILKVSDDGKGIPKALSGSEGRGMDIMRYRARLIGARVDVSSQAGEGTSVTCILPAGHAAGLKPGKP